MGDPQEGGRPHVLTGSKPRKSPGAPPACAPLPPPPTSRRQHFLLFCQYPFSNRLGFNHSHVLTPVLPPSKGIHPAFLRPEPSPPPPKNPFVPSRRPSKLATTHPQPIFRTPLPPLALAAPLAVVKALLSRWHRQCRKPPHDRPEQPPCQVPFRQQQPIVPRMFHEAATRLHQSLLQARQRPGPNPPRHASLRHRLPGL